MSFGATCKEVVLTNFFKELKLTVYTYRVMYIVMFIILVMMGVMMCVVDSEYRIHDLWAVFPLATCVAGHILTPLLLNPVLMRINF